MSKKRCYTDKDLIEAVKSSLSIRCVLEKLGKCTQGGGSYNQIKTDLKRLGLDVSHFTGKGHLKGRAHNWATRTPLENILVCNSEYTNRTALKNRLLKEGLLKNECAVCNLKGEWNGKQLTMILDHVNGVNNDNRKENLRMICPNCNSQQATFAGRNMKRGSVVELAYTPLSKSGSARIVGSSPT